MLISDIFRGKGGRNSFKKGVSGEKIPLPPTESVLNLVHCVVYRLLTQHPQTVTGAYLSGIREACKIMNEL